MVQQLDIIYSVAEKQGLDFNFLLADLSQQAGRRLKLLCGQRESLSYRAQVQTCHVHPTLIPQLSCLKPCL